MADVELISCAIADADRRVLLAHRSDHNQWQLLGGRVLYGESPFDAIQRQVTKAVKADVTRQRYMAGTVFTQGGAEYACQWWQGHINQEPELVDTERYDEIAYFNLYKRDIARVGLSPNVERFAEALQHGEIHLIPSNLVQ